MPVVDLPSKIKPGIDLFAHQIEGIEWLRKRPSWLLADDLGLGKSIQALAAAAYDFDNGAAKRALIVATATVKYNWVEELKKWTTFTYTMLEGPPKKREAILNSFDTDDFLLVNYEQVKTHLAVLNEMDFDIVMFDECHTIRNSAAQRTRAALKLLAYRYFLITGSPMLNKVNELWVPLHRIDPTMVPKEFQFRARFCVFGGWQGKDVIGVKNQKELHGILHNVMLRRLKKDVLDLPEKQIIPVMVDLHPEQRKLYKEAWEDMRITMPDDPDPMELENALTRFLRLKQICSTTANIEGFEDHSIKLDRAMEIIEEVGEHIVLFTQFRGTQRAMMARLARAKIPALELNGDTPPSTRVEIVKRWASSPPGALVCMIQVAGVGLNMTAASKVIFLDKLFVPKLNEQAQDRAYRIGADLTKPVMIFELIARKTIEQRIETILRQKTELFNELIETPVWKRNFFRALMEASDDA